MYRYGDYCPLAKTTTVMGDYWTPLIVRELLHGREHFNDLVRSLPDISRSLLAARLKAMERGGIVECARSDARNATAYRLTEAGLELRTVLDAMSRWGERWTPEPEHESDVHPMTAVCMLRARVNGEALPDRRVVLQIETLPPKRSLSWFVLENCIASMCAEHPGFDADIVLTTDVPALYAIWLDRLTVSDAVKSGQMRLEGDRALIAAFPGWFGGISQNLAGHFEDLIPVG
jgi:DNA-binding HxlR family transcriptional regulator